MSGEESKQPEQQQQQQQPEAAPSTNPRSNTTASANANGAGTSGGGHNHHIPIHRLSIPTGPYHYNDSAPQQQQQQRHQPQQSPFHNHMYSPPIPPHTAARVLKGEIHNVLTVMRADARYVSPHRFEDELVEQYEHPLLNKFRDLHATLCAWESSPQSELPDALVWLGPFCDAIQGRDINASVTGSALSALHKFVLYGFLTNTPHTHSAVEAMTWMSQALLQCTFEESNVGQSAVSGVVGAVTGSTAKYFESGGGTSSLDVSTSSRGAHAAAAGSSAGLALRRTATNESLTNRHSTHQTPHRSQSGDGGPTNTSRTVVGTMLLHDDEQVVLKLLELSALVVRCSLHPSEPLVSTDLIVGLLDTCLHVSHRAKRASPLLKSAAADALGQIVLQVFSAITSPTRSQQQLGRSNTADTIETTDSMQNNASPSRMKNNQEEDGFFSPLLETRREILLKLTNLLNPQQNSDATCATSLTLMNMAFETLREDFTAAEIAILHNDFCKYLLQWSTTHDLMILNLTLRVIFNLFQSMRNHLKVPLEVFLTSVHLRILDPTSSATSEEREVALESLLEFCQEVALMQDIYLNYDCDISCTNLYEAICTTLGRVACAGTNQHQFDSNRVPSLIPSAGSTLPTTMESSSSTSFTTNSATDANNNFRSQPTVRNLVAPTKPTAAGDDNTIISDLSSHGGTIAAGSMHSPKGKDRTVVGVGLQNQTPVQQIPLNILNKLALDGILAILDSIFRRCQSHLRYEDMMQNNNNNSAGGDGGSLDGSITASHADGNLRWQMAPKDMSEEVLQERKIRKHLLALIAIAFNEDPFADTWIQISKEHNILPTLVVPKSQSPTDQRIIHPLGVAPDDVAGLLYSTHGLDKANIGEFISKGPKEKYPFHAQVLEHFVARFDFSDSTFAGAIRKFLSKFRLPGEAQCIDRLMEAFSKELYQQQKGRQQQIETSSVDGAKGEIKELVPENENEDNEEEDGKEKPTKTTQFVFKNSDAVFVLSFSTIMLNTDLHNPGIKKNRRMTVQQFIKNNRGINDGEDLPEDFLAELYQQIKTKEIQVQAEVGEFFSMTQTMMNASTNSNSKNVQEAFRTSWDSVLSSRTQNVATAFFTPPYAARQSIERAGIHDKEMFVTIANCGAAQSLAGVFSRSWDDDLVVRSLRGLKQMAKMCEFFETDEILNEILQFLLRLGRDYIMGCTALEHSGYDSGAPILPNGRMPMAVLGEDNDEAAIIDKESPVPSSLLCTPKGVDPLHASFAVHVIRNTNIVRTGSGDDGEDDNLGDDDETEADDDSIDVTGSAAHRGLLALDTAFLMLRSHAPRVRDAWPSFIDTICALRDARGLPTGLSDLDDFADSNGNVLPLSTYAQMSQKRLEDHYRALLGKDKLKKDKGWLRSFWGQKKPEGSKLPEESERSQRSTSQDFGPGLKEELSTFSLRLLDVAENCDVEKIVVQMGSSSGNEDEPCSPEQQLHHEQQSIAIQALLNSLDDYPFEDDPVTEQHALFSLELAARALLTNREKAPELFSLFLVKFENILGRIDDENIPAPFMVERVVVTILRSSIHLYDLPEVS